MEELIEVFELCKRIWK